MFGYSAVELLKILELITLNNEYLEIVVNQHGSLK
jgi:hypothetical protein